MPEQQTSSVILRAWPDTDHVITEDDEPVDNLFVEREQHLLVETIHVGWSGPSDGRHFFAMSNVGIFETVNHPPIVPDVLIVIGVPPPPDALRNEWRSYFMEGYGKPPDVVVEIVSIGGGDEDTRKLDRYRELGVPYYLIHDPYLQISKELLRIFRLEHGGYVRQHDPWLAAVELGVRFWEGVYDGLPGNFLRWTDRQGNLLASGQEVRARADQLEAENVRLRALLRQQNDER